ncbi:homeobox protein ESX1-like [Leopardus geoffroyi]|uniref:homeobox protein ESX1-like n=1 Tax=Leopardus geoffroyi TaxID=46844 RepID=UPI001E260E2F|nr:homeobox protein ESX1-like [Leopardus geoffroyi]
MCFSPLRACELEKVMAEQSREVAYLKCRLEVIHKQRLPEESRRHKPMAAGPDREIPPWRGYRPPTPSAPWWPLGPYPPPPPPPFEPLANPEAGVAPVSQNKHFTKNAEKDKGSVDPWGPPLLTGRFCTPYPRGPPMGYRACPPPEPWWPWGPPQTCLPTLHGVSCGDGMGLYTQKQT